MIPQPELKPSDRLVIAAWDILHVRDTGEIGFSDLADALQTVGLGMLDELVEQLVWCSGALSFQPDQEAHWVAHCRPLLDRSLRVGAISVPPPSG